MCPLLSVRFYSIILYSVFNEHFSSSEVSFLKVVGSSGLEPPTSRLSGARSNHLSYEPIKLLPVYLFTLAYFVTSVTGGDDGIRTHDPLLAGQVLSQLSYTPIFSGFFPVTEN